MAKNLQNSAVCKDQKSLTDLSLPQKTGCQKLLLLTDHQYDNITYNGHDIEIRPVYDYALDK